MADGNFPTLVSATRDANISTNPIFVRLTDGTNNVSFTGTSLDVNITGGASSGTEFAEDSAHTTGDNGTQVLAVRQDTLASSVDTDGDYASLKVNNVGALYVNVSNTVTVAATDLDIRDLTSASDSVSVLQATHDSLNANANLQVGDADVANGNPVPVSDAAGSLTVDAVDLDIRNLNLTDDAVKVSANATANSITNPIFVQVVSQSITSTEIHDYDTSASVAADTADNHDYTVAGTTFLLKSVIAAFSGGGKVEIQTGPLATLVSRAVSFVPKDGGHVQLNFDPPIEVPSTSTGTVRVIRTNRQGQAQDVYSTIIGNDIP